MRTVLSKFFDKQGPQHLLKDMCFLFTLVVPSLIFITMGTAFSSALYLFKIGKIKNCLCSATGHPTRTLFSLFCAVLLQTVCAARSFVTSFFTTTGLGHEDFSSFWQSMVTHHAFIPGKGPNSHNNNKKRADTTKPTSNCKFFSINEKTASLRKKAHTRDPTLFELAVVAQKK